MKKQILFMILYATLFSTNVLYIPFVKSAEFLEEAGEEAMGAAGEAGAEASAEGTSEIFGDAVSEDGGNLFEGGGDEEFEPQNAEEGVDDAMKGETPEPETPEINEPEGNLGDEIKGEAGEAGEEAGEGKPEEEGESNEDEEKEEEGKKKRCTGRVCRVFSSVVKGLFGHVMNGVLGGIMMNIPAALEQAFIAEQQRKAKLLQLSAPLEFAGMVLQVPDSVIDVDDPANSLKVYYGVPVKKVGDEIGGGGAAVSSTTLVAGPSKDNKVSQKIDKISTGFSGAMEKAFFTMMALNAPSHSETNERYTAYSPNGKNPGFFDSQDAHLLLMYPTDGFTKKFGEYGINEEMFSGYLVDLNTGLVVNTEAESDSYGPVKLLGAIRQGSTVEQFLEVFENELKTGKTKMTFEEYGDDASPSKAFEASNSLMRQFSIVCLKNGLSNDCLTSEGLRACIMAHTLQQIAAGIAVSYDGKQIKTGASLETKDEQRFFSNADIDKEVARGALGSVRPIQGMGSGLKDYLQNNFPDAKQLNPKDAGAFAVVFKSAKVGDMEKEQSLGANSGKVSTKTVDVQGAQPKNYAAQGLHVYESENTPFARQLKQMSGAHNVKDYIVFFDKDLNVVPLQSPQIIDSEYHFPDMMINPDAVYWQSLISYDLEDFQKQYTQGESFTPLFTLFGENSSSGYVTVKVNGAEQAIKQAVSKLNREVDLAQQIAFIKAAELQLYRSGPFYKPYNLKPVPKEQYMTQKGLNIVAYTGTACYPMPQNPGSEPQVTDYLIPFEPRDGKTMTAVLPNHNVTKFVSLVSDIVFDVYTTLEQRVAREEKVGKEDAHALAALIAQTYSEKGANGVCTYKGKQYKLQKYHDMLVSGNAFQKVLVPASYGNSQLLDKEGLQLDASKPAMVFLNRLEKSGAKVPAALKQAVTASHKQWMNWLEIAKKSPLNKNGGAQLKGIEYGLSYTLRIVDEQDFMQANFMYTCSPSPSGISGDVYVMSDSLNLSNTTLGLQANAENPQRYLVSVATGMVFDQTGSHARDDNGVVVRFDPQQVLNVAFANQQKQFGKAAKGVSAAVKKHIAHLRGQGKELLNKIEGPFEFGPLVLHMRNIDALQGNYLYFTLGEDQKPSQYFVGLQNTKKPYKFGEKISGDTKYMVNLVTGQLYTRQGANAVWKNVESLFDLVASKMTISREDSQKITQMHKAFMEQKAAEEKQYAKVKEQEDAQKALVKEDLQNTAANVGAASNLSGAYSDLRKDAQGKYYRVTVGPDGSNVIADFNATTEAKDAKVGAIFNEKGELMTVLQGYMLDVMRKHSGVNVSSSGKQTLAVPQTEPTLSLKGVDTSLKPGQSGQALIASDHKDFPCKGIEPVHTQGVSYYFYYHRFMHQYFVYVDDTSNQEQFYVNLDSGASYHIDGLPRIAQYAVAENSAGDSLFVRRNQNDMLACTMQDKADKKHGKRFVEFTNSESKFTFGKSNGTIVGINELVGSQPPYTSVKIVQYPLKDQKEKYNDNATMYNVYWPKTKKPETYQVRSGIFYENLQYVPMSSSGEYVSRSIAADLQSVQLMRDSSGVVGLLFGSELYKPQASKKGATSSGMQLVNEKGDTLQIQESTDGYTQMPYIQITKGSDSYIYGYAYEMVSESQLSSYMADVWNVSLSVSLTSDSLLVRDFDVSKLQSVSVPMKQHTDGLSDVQGVPAERRASVEASIGDVFYASDINRFVAKVPAGSYTYFNQKGYVDIAHGVIYDQKGNAFGYALTGKDFTVLLDRLSVMSVFDDTSGRYRIVYRSPMQINKQTKSMQSQQKAMQATSQS